MLSTEHRFPTRTVASNLQSLASGRNRLPMAMATMGFDTMRYGQKEIVDMIMAERDVLCILPTGQGKSACFVLPALANKWPVVIFSPLTALMRDQVQSLQKRGISAGELTGLKKDVENQMTMEQWAMGDLQFLYAAPERMANARFMELMNTRRPHMLVVDECFPPDVEILTDNGFTRFGDLQEGARCAQFDAENGCIDFVVPEKLIRKPFSGELVRLLSDRFCDLDMTPGHELLVSSSGVTSRITAGNFIPTTVQEFIVAGKHTGGSSAKLSPTERLNIAFQSVGFLHREPDQSGYAPMSFTFTNSCAAKRFQEVLVLGKFLHSEVKTSKCWRFTVRGVPACSTLLSDNFTLTDLGFEKARSLIEELAYWCGQITHHNRYYYVSDIKANADFAQAIAVLAGYKSVVKNPKSYEVLVSTDTDKVPTAQIKKTLVPYSGDVYCVRVPRGNIVVRRNGKVVVTGNCHCLSQWGDSFREHYKFLGDFVRDLNPRVVAAFSATVPEDAEDEIREVLGIKSAARLEFFSRRSNLVLSSEDYPDDNAFVGYVTRTQGSAIVYCTSIKRVEQYASLISNATSDLVAVYHGEMDPSAKRTNMDMFMSDDARIIVATNAFGMGVDKSNVANIIHRDIPKSSEALIQECVHPDSWISTSAGIKLATEVGLGENMIDYCFKTGQAKSATVIETMSNKNIEDLFEIRTKLGSTLRVTGKHPVFVSKLGRVEEVAAANLVVGSRVLAQLNLAPSVIRSCRIIDLLLDCPEPVFVLVKPELVDLLRDKISLSNISKVFELSRLYDYNSYKHGKAARLSCWLNACKLADISEDTLIANIVNYKTRSSSRILLPKFIDPDLGWLAGIMATDGYMFSQPSGSDGIGYGSWKIKMGNTDVVIASKFACVLEGMGLHVSKAIRHAKMGDLGRKDMFVYETSSPILQHLLVKMGIPTGKKTYSVRVPAHMFCAPAAVRGAYLAGVIDGDGSVRKAGHNIRVHSASWDMLSGLCMLFRGFGIPTTAYAEDYTCKLDVMTAAVDHGYSLRVTSNEHYDIVREFVAPYMCKELEVELSTPREGFAHVRLSRRASVDCAGEQWLEDEVIEISRIPFKGAVLNWHIKPGNQLVVNGVLTHNCGRGGRNGETAWCKMFYSDRSLDTARFFVKCENPSESDVRSVFMALQTLSTVTPNILISQRDLAQMCGLHDRGVPAIITRLKAAKVIEKSDERPTVAGVAFADGVPSVTQLFAATRDAVYANVLESKGDTLLFDLCTVSEDLGVSLETLKGRFYRAQKDGLLAYYPPFRGTPMRITGDIRQVNFDKLREQARVAEIKLQQVLDYHATPDAQKHDFLESIFGQKQNV